MMPPLKKTEIVGGEDPACRCRRINVGRVDEWTDAASCPVHAETQGRGDVAGPVGCTCLWQRDSNLGFTYVQAGPCPIDGHGHYQHWCKLTRLERNRIVDLRASASPRDSTDFIKGLLGQTPPSGRLFEVTLIDGEARFQITGLGLGLQLDSVTAQALRDVLEHGIRHCQRIHLTDRAAELVASNGGHV